MDKEEVLQAIQISRKLENLVYDTTHAYCKKIGKTCRIDSGPTFDVFGEHINVDWESHCCGQVDIDNVSFPTEYLWKGVPVNL